MFNSLNNRNEDETRDEREEQSMNFRWTEPKKMKTIQFGMSNANNKIMNLS